MDLDLTERIRARAYELWESEGCPAGRDLEFWLQAERELFEQPAAAARALAEEIAATLPKLGRRRKRAA